MVTFPMCLSAIKFVGLSRCYYNNLTCDAARYRRYLQSTHDLFLDENPFATCVCLKIQAAILVNWGCCIKKEKG